MTPFVDLFRKAKGLHPSEEMALVQDRLPDAVKNAGSTMYAQSHSMPLSGERILIGIAPYSAYDFQLLDCLAQAVRKAPTDKLRIEVFDVLIYKQMSDFERHIPGLGNVYQTPVVGIWSNGVLVNRSWGFRAQRLLAARFDFTTDQLNLHPCLPTTSPPPKGPLT